jgi:hypothetical protein
VLDSYNRGERAAKTQSELERLRRAFELGNGGL